MLALFVRNFEFSMTEKDIAAVKIEEVLIQHPRNLKTTIKARNHSISH